MAASKVSPVTTALPSIFYEDPEPVEDGMQQAPVIVEIAHMLTAYFKSEPEVFVSAGGFIFYDPSNGNRRIAPDLYIAFDVDVVGIRLNLPNYWMWQVGKAPDFVMEVASPSTASNDLGHKRDLYARLGIAEYWRLGPDRRRPVRRAAGGRTPGGWRVPALRAEHRCGWHLLGVQRGSRPALLLGL